MKTTRKVFVFLLMVSESLGLSTELNISPKTLSGTRNLVYARPGETVTMNCSIVDVKEPSFRWTFNDSALQAESSVLLVEGVSDEQEGEYTCVVTSGMGTLRSETLTLKLAEVKKLSDGSNRREHDAVDLLPCDVQLYSVPPARVSWFRNQKLLSSDVENMYTDINGSLVFLYKTLDDMSAVYRCMANNTVLNISFWGNRKFFRSRSVNVRPQTRPMIVSSTQQVTGVAGEDVILECVFVGDPIPQISWQKVGFDESNENSKHITLRRHQLIFSKIRLSDAGQYRCIANNARGTVTETVHLQVKPKASAKIFPESRTVLVGSDVIMRCAPLTGINFKWYVDGTSFKNIEKDHFNMSEDKTSLTIYPSGNSTNGLCVQCDVTDDHTYSLYSACVKYVDSVDQLPTTLPPTDSTILNSTYRPTFDRDSQLIPIWGTIVLATVAALCVVSAVIIITVLLIRKGRRGRKKKVDTRVSTVGCHLPTRTSILCEIDLLED